jgi:hypothetical protein
MGSRIAREVLPNGVNGTVEEGKRWAFRLQGRSGHGVQIQPTRSFVATVQVDACFVAEVVRVLLKGVVGSVCGCLPVYPKECERQQGAEHRG